LEPPQETTGFLARWRASQEANRQVQGEATMESLRRFRGVACFTAPLHAILALVFASYSPPAAHPELAQWARALVDAQLAAFVGVLIAGLMTHALLRHRACIFTSAPMSL